MISDVVWDLKAIGKTGYGEFVVTIVVQLKLCSVCCQTPNNNYWLKTLTRTCGEILIPVFKPFLTSTV